VITLSRRALLTAALGTGVLGAGGLAGVATGVLPGRTRLATAVDQVLPVDGPARPAGPIRRGRFVSAARRGADVGWLVAYPPVEAVRGVARLPVVVALPGLGGDENGVLGLDLPGYLADAVAAGVPPFAVASVGGGTSYWHARRSGEDAGRMLTDELLPLLSRLPAELDGAPVPVLETAARDRIGFYGWSMGGYGALLLTEHLGPARVSAVAASSPALWRRAADAAPGAFDDAADFARHDVFAWRPRLKGVSVRIDCGDGDPFVDAARDFVAGLSPSPAGSFGIGAHDGRYWRRVAPAQLAFLGRALART
jgi:S-formylglutathione hydrolase FrmB